MDQNLLQMHFKGKAWVLLCLFKLLKPKKHNSESVRPQTKESSSSIQNKQAQSEHLNQNLKWLTVCPTIKETTQGGKG